MSMEAYREIPDYSFQPSSPESGEGSIEAEIMREGKRLAENVARLEQDIDSFGGYDELAKAAKDRDKEAVGRKVANRALTLIGFGCIAMALHQGIKTAEQECPDEYDSAIAALVTTASTVLRQSDNNRLPEEMGRGNFTREKTEEQRAWLKSWLEQRRLSTGETQQDRQKMIDYVAGVKVMHADLDEKRVGAYLPYGEGGSPVIELNRLHDGDEAHKSVPLHELSHAADHGGRMISDEEKELVPGLTRRADQQRAIFAGTAFATPEYHAYVTKPTEIKARLMVIRKMFDLKPNQVVDDEAIERIYDAFFSGQKEGDLTQVIDIFKDKESLKRALNEMAANEISVTDQPEMTA